ncbi:MAG: ABC transporter permease [Pseudomonadota bacterium]
MSQLVATVLVFALAGVAAVAALATPALQGPIVTAVLAGLVLAGLIGLYHSPFERFAGLRYLHRRQSPARARRLHLGMVVAAAAGLGALALFFATRGKSRVSETIAVVTVLVAGLSFVLLLLLRLFSVFTTVSTMGVVLGVQSLIVVLAVTSGFQREFQDKVLALNAHLIVIPYGDVDVDSVEAEEISEKLRDLPGVVRRAKFLFSAGEVMVGNIGANLKGIDLGQGADDLRRALVDGSVADLARPASCAVAGAVPGAPGQVAAAGRIVLGYELAHRLRRKVGDCVSIMVPFSNAGDAAPPSFLFKVVGRFRMGFNEYDTRLAYVSLEDARKLASARQSVFGVELRFADPQTAIPMAKEVRRRLDGPYRVVDWQELNHNLFTALKMQKVAISLLLVLIILVAAFNIIASLTMIVLSKVREIAILKSMGAPADMLARLFLVAGTSVGGVGTALGIACGLMVCGLAQLYGYPLDPKVYLIGRLPVDVTPREIIALAAATLAICVLATLYPSLRASRMRAVDGLRYN